MESILTSYLFHIFSSWHRTNWRGLKRYQKIEMLVVLNRRIFEVNLKFFLNFEYFWWLVNHPPKNLNHVRLSLCIIMIRKAWKSFFLHILISHHSSNKFYWLRMTIFLSSSTVVRIYNNSTFLKLKQIFYRIKFYVLIFLWYSM